MLILEFTFKVRIELTWKMVAKATKLIVPFSKYALLINLSYVNMSDMKDLIIWNVLYPSINLKYLLFSLL